MNESFTYIFALKILRFRKEADSFSLSRHYLSRAPSESRWIWIPFTIKQVQIQGDDPSINFKKLKKLKRQRREEKWFLTREIFTPFSPRKYNPLNLHLCRNIWKKCIENSCKVKTSLECSIFEIRDLTWGVFAIVSKIYRKFNLRLGETSEILFRPKF